MSLVSKGQDERRREILGFLILGFTTLLFLALTTDEYRATPVRSLDGITQVPNGLGMGGAIVAGVLSILVGPAAHVSLLSHRRVGHHAHSPPCPRPLSYPPSRHVCTHRVHCSPAPYQRPRSWREHLARRARSVISWATRSSPHSVPSGPTSSRAPSRSWGYCLRPNCSSCACSMRPAGPSGDLAWSCRSR